IPRWHTGGGNISKRRCLALYTRFDHSSYVEGNKKAHKFCKLMGFKDGTRGRTRTGMPVKAGDFESPVSTNFTTLAMVPNYKQEFATLKVLSEKKQHWRIEPCSCTLATSFFYL